MTPNPRYYALNKAITALRAGVFDTRIKGVDELSMQHDNVMLGANTSFQIHFQVGPEEFANLYNVAQLVTAPALAAAVNSPLLLERLWRETRVALFQQSVDARSLAHQARGQRTRVRFGDAWLEKSVLEIFREDIARFRVVLGADCQAESVRLLKEGKIPQLDALRLHNGTVYRWNRPCYGVHNGVAHLRIENRSLPSGPSVIDEVANAAFFFGLMVAKSEEYEDVAKVFDLIRPSQFLHAARHSCRRNSIKDETGQRVIDSGRSSASGTWGASPSKGRLRRCRYLPGDFGRPDQVGQDRRSVASRFMERNADGCDPG